MRAFFILILAIATVLSAASSSENAIKSSGGAKMETSAGRLLRAELTTDEAYRPFWPLSISSKRRRKVF
ncbi:hypothetical protein GN958_ATG08794 [Phytophthora infestans]|uniref:RxLR effector protein n=1 Tax=Phytophthora infestans TaxID=4787 RepID=A0A8S9UKP7_PHYIN|nr:hypothetical protein GN958_ATG15851 [Phytophthora infestans]KAF4140052.1 hypothetical protein GN958_ATG10802 [Phytophthora infestans]KAF4142012.1 hypothetical protein GN958_ATG08794 [Phytophthora infestans]